jgi:hypothetical protein
MTAQFYRNGMEAARDGNLMTTRDGKVSQVTFVGKVECGTIRGKQAAEAENVGEKENLATTMRLCPSTDPIGWRTSLTGFLSSETLRTSFTCQRSWRGAFTWWCGLRERRLKPELRTNLPAEAGL